MLKKHLSANLIQYTFLPLDDEPYGYNIYAVLGQNNKAILIDSAFETQAELVRDDLLRNGIYPVAVVVSHFHADHFEGVKSFEDIEILGSEDYNCTFETIYKKKDLHAFAPNKLISNGDVIENEGFQLEFFKGKGHSECGIITVIDRSFVHVGDLLMADKDNNPILPLIGSNLITDHIESLEYISRYNKHTILLSHGEPIEGEAKIDSEICQRLHYLESISNAPKEISIQEAVRKCNVEFTNLHWHKYNLKNK